ncbi:hypothetical protein LPTSP4_21950 [Leptospira ryugenii]|uniref:Uncharacterized protein n=1 Tax=Leptospira ryugenii TaxID=1917863 RepID=A0A2P2E1A3_9LEPT|nr:hypothetical protein LPTSP4_21950 [Leptospira ryugenii]
MTMKSKQTANEIGPVMPEKFKPSLAMKLKVKKGKTPPKLKTVKMAVMENPIANHFALRDFSIKYIGPER